MCIVKPGKQQLAENDYGSYLHKQKSLNNIFHTWKQMQYECWIKKIYGSYSFSEIRFFSYDIDD